MMPHDQQRFAQLVSDFVGGCGIEPPLFLVAIGSDGAVVVSRHTPSSNQEVCASPGALVSPILLTVIGLDGRGKSARIEIEAARGRMQ